MKDTIIKLFNLEPSELHGVEIVSTDHTVYAIITLNVATDPASLRPILERL